MLQAITNSTLVPARVLDMLDRRVCLETVEGGVWATLALTGGYQPVRGDVVLAAGAEDAWYVIGVISAQGPTTLSAAADLNLLAPNGAVNIIATRGITVRSPEVRVQAGRLEMAARSIFQRFGSAISVIRDLWQIRAGQLRTDVRESSHLNAARIVQRAEEDVTIDGESINLG